jgi:hypothetical protein
VEASHVYAPGYPLVRLAPNEAVQTSKAAEKGACKKGSSAHNSLTPGLLTFFCGHGVCIGFKFMDRCEGPSQVHQFLYTRFESGKSLAMLRQHLQDAHPNVQL